MTQLDNAQYDSTQYAATGSPQDEVGWLLKTIRTEYPYAWPDDLLRRNRDESYNLETDERTEAVSLDRWTVVGVSSGSVTRQLYGTKPQYRVTTELDVRVEAKSDDEWGEQTDDTSFNQMVNYIQYAINTALTYPTIQAPDPIGKIDYLDLGITDEQRLSSGYKDTYRTDFTVRLRGNQDTP